MEIPSALHHHWVCYDRSSDAHRHSALGESSKILYASVHCCPEDAFVSSLCCSTSVSTNNQCTLEYSLGGGSIGHYRSHIDPDHFVAHCEIEITVGEGVRCGHLQQRRYT